jgi:hypothetical protein
MHWIWKANIKEPCVNKSHKFLFYVFDQELSLGAKSHLPSLKEKQIIQPPLLPTNVALLQKARSNWIFERALYTFQTKSDSILTQIQQWVWEKQLIEPKVQRLCHGNHSMHPITNPSTSNPHSSLTKSPIKLSFWEGLLHLSSSDWFNFDPNPTVDLR